MPRLYYRSDQEGVEKDNIRIMVLYDVLLLMKVGTGDQLHTFCREIG